MNTQGPARGKISLSFLISVIALAGIFVASDGAPGEQPETADRKGPVELKIGETVEGEITEDDPIFETEILRKSYTSAPTRGKTFQLRAAEPGPHWVELKSFAFDSYLVLRGADGAVMAEDDDGLRGTHSRIAVPSLDSGTTYSLAVCALHGKVGEFELFFSSGEPKALSEPERRLLAIEDARGAVRWSERATGPEHQETAARLYDLAALLPTAGLHEEARQEMERSLAIREKTLGPEHPLTGDSLAGLGEILRRQGRYREARPLCERALAIYEKVGESELSDMALVLGILASVLVELVEYEESESLYLRALAATEKVHGPDHFQTARAVNNLATLYLKLGALEKVRPLFERSLTIREKVLGPNHPDTARGLGNLAMVLRAQELHDEARPLVERALAINEKAFGPQHPRVASTLGSLAGLLKDQGHVDEAQPLYERSLAIREQVLGPDHPDTAISLNHLGRLLKEQGLYDKARPLFERSLAVTEKVYGPDHPTTAAILFNQAGLLEVMGLFEEVRPLYERALAILETAYGSEHGTTATTLGELARFLSDQEKLDEARVLFERALAIRNRLGPNHSDTALILSNFGVLLLQMERWAEAQIHFERSLAIFESVFGLEHPRVAGCQHNLALSLKCQGRFEGALPLYERALETWEKVYEEGHPARAEILKNLADLDADLGEFSRAVGRSKIALAAHEALMDRTFGAQTEAERVRSLQSLEGSIASLLGMTRLDASGSIGEQEVHQFLLRWKGRVFRSLLSSPLEQKSAEDSQRLVRLKATQKALSDVLYEVPTGDRARATREDKLRRLKKRRNELELDLTRNRRVKEQREEGDLREVLDRVAEDAVVLDFFVHRIYSPAEREGGKLKRRGRWSSEWYLTAWVVGPGGETNRVKRVELGEAAPIEEAVKAFLEELVTTRGLAPAGGNEQPITSPANDRLRELLWKPLQEHVGNAAMVIVSPDSFLGTLPFETLQMKKGHYLVESHSFVYLQDLLGLTKLEEGAEPKKVEEPNLLAAGGIDYRRREDLPEESTDSDASRAPAAQGSTRGSYRSTWRPLSATRDEAEAIADIHDEAFEESGARLFLKKKAATEERIKEELPKASYVHLATHGYFQPEGLPSMWENEQRLSEGPVRLEMRETERVITGLLPGLLSGLVFAGANKDAEPGRDNGLLTAEEVTFIDLSRCELVVLSACETGLGRAESGEGLIGLRRSFRAAGARTVISSLWSVKDEATADLMTMFYENLWLKKMGKLSALRTAQLEMLKRNRAEYGEGLPSTWGAFVLDGDWR